MDLFNRDIIGWNLSSNMTAKETVLASLNKVAKQYSIDQGMISHSDRGSQYAYKATRNTLRSYGIIQSMSRAGNCWDNAVAESFFKSLKTEFKQCRLTICPKKVRSSNLQSSTTVLHLS